MHRINRLFPTTVGAHQVQDFPSIGPKYIYVARTYTNEEIYVKFTDRYSDELHTFCADRKLAPALLGFERLHGGWFVVAMEKATTGAFPQTLESHQIKAWKEEIQALVHDFHEEGLVHGDLRPLNFILVPGDTPKMLLVDFDWGGKEGERDGLR